jgi:hypothetical protein
LVLPIVLALFGLAGSASAQNATADTLRALAIRISQLELRRQLASATAATVDSLLSFYTDSVVYEHPNAGAVVRGKTLMRRGMTQYIGSIRAVQADAPKVTVGHGVAIVDATVRMEVDDGGKWTPVVRHGIRVIEFDRALRVRRIIDYPW